MNIIVKNETIVIEENTTKITFHNNDWKVLTNEYSQYLLDKVNSNSASISSEAILRINGDTALAQDITTLSSTVDNNKAEADSSISTLTTANQAVASRTTSLEATSNDLDVRLTTNETVVAGHFDIWDGLSDPKIGQIQLTDGVQYQFLGGTLGENGDGWVRTDFSAKESLENFVAVTYKDDMDYIQGQLDGNVTSWFYAGEPTLSNLPASDWTDDATKDLHTGDLYYDTDTGYSYRFILSDGTYSWLKLVDSDATKALADAAAAQDTADHKRRVFVVEPVPPYDVGDLWLTNNGDLLASSVAKADGESYNAADWDIAPKYTDDTTANEVKGWVANASSLVVDPDTGQVTGWQYGDGTGFDSLFKISADNIIMDGTTTFVKTGDDVSTLNNDSGFINNTQANAVTENGITKIKTLYGGTYSGGVDTGCIVIVLPMDWSKTMMKFDIDVFDYVLNKSFKLQVAGYNYYPDSGAAYWENTAVQLIGNTEADNRVRFGHNGSKCVIIIGDTTSSWDHLKVSVNNGMFGYLNYSIAQWQTGWDVQILDDLTGIAITKDYSDALLDAKAIKNQGALATKNLVETSELGTTVIDGGYIKTELLTADNIQAGLLVADRIKLNGTFLTSSSGNLDIVNNSISRTYTGSLITPTLEPDGNDEIYYKDFLISSFTTTATSKISVTLNISTSLFAAEGSESVDTINATYKLLINDTQQDSFSSSAIGNTVKDNVTLVGSIDASIADSYVELVITGYTSEGATASIDTTAKALVIVMDR